MRKVKVPLTNFQYGEISPSLISRTDSEIYNSSAQRMKNFFIRAEGGVLKRGGFQALHKFSSVTVDNTKRQQIRLFPFIFSDDEQYVVAMSNNKLEIFFIDPSTGALSLVTTLTQDTDSVALPFSENILHEITFAQGGDVLFLCHNSFMCRQLVRTGLNSFQVELYVFQQEAGGARIHQPYYPFHPFGVTLNPAASTGSGVTVTTSQAYFDTTGSQSGGNFPNSKHVGVSLRYHDSELFITSVQSTTQATVNIVDTLRVELAADALRTVDGSSDIEVTHINHGMSNNDSVTIEDAGSVGGINANQINGSRTILKVIDENRYKVTVGAAANASEDGGGFPKIVTHAPTSQWSEQSYSAVLGFPAAVGFHENRLWFGGTLSQPDFVWASKTALYYNFDLGTSAANDSIELVASIGEIGTIRHFVSNRDIHIFTASSEFYIPTFQNEPITPLNAQMKRQTNFGAGFVRPEPFYGATVFNQIGGKMIRQFVYDDTENAYKSDPISVLSSHLINDPVQMCIVAGAVNTSESFIFILNFTGDLAVYNVNKLENRAGWSNFVTDGSFHSIMAIESRVFAVIEYDLGAGTKKFILTELNANMNIDNANNYTGSSGVFNVSNFFDNGAVVDVVSATDYLGQFTVAGGNVDVSAVDSGLTSCQVGFGFDVELKSNPIDIGISTGPLTGEPRTIGKVILDLNNTLSVSVNGTKLFIRKVNDDFSQIRQAVTGKKEFYLLGYNRDPQVVVTQTAPLGIQVNSIIAEVTF